MQGGKDGGREQVFEYTCSAGQQRDDLFCFDRTALHMNRLYENWKQAPVFSPGVLLLSRPPYRNADDRLITHCSSPPLVQVAGPISVWYSEHSTPNPNELYWPRTQMVHGNKFLSSEKASSSHSASASQGSKRTSIGGKLFKNKEEA